MTNYFSENRNLAFQTAVESGCFQQKIVNNSMIVNNLVQWKNDKSGRIANFGTISVTQRANS